MTRNVTLKIDEALLKKSRKLALAKEQSLSQWLTDLLVRAINEDGRYRRAKKRALDRLEEGFHLGGRPLSRDASHER